MTSDRKAGLSSTVRPAGPERFRRGSRLLLLVGVLLALAVPGRAAQAMQGPPDWVEELSLADKVAEGSVTLASHVYLASHVSRAEAHDHLERLGLERLGRDGGALLDPEVSIRGSDAFHGVLEARADWAAYRLELNGKFAAREFTEVLGQAMTVTAVISSEGLRISDDRGGSRTEAYRRFPLDACDRGSERGGCADPALFHPTFDEASDDHGTIVEVVRVASRVERRLPCRVGGFGGGPTRSCPSRRLRTSGASSMPVAAGVETTSSVSTTPTISCEPGSGSGKATGASSWKRRADVKAWHRSRSFIPALRC